MYRHTDGHEQIKPDSDFKSVRITNDKSIYYFLRRYKKKIRKAIITYKTVVIKKPVAELQDISPQSFLYTAFLKKKNYYRSGLRNVQKV